MLISGRMEVPLLVLSYGTSSYGQYYMVLYNNVNFLRENYASLIGIDRI